MDRGKSPKPFSYFEFKANSGQGGQGWTDPISAYPVQRNYLSYKTLYKVDRVDRPILYKRTDKTEINRPSISVNTYIGNHPVHPVHGFLSTMRNQKGQTS